MDVSYLCSSLNDFYISLDSINGSLKSYEHPTLGKKFLEKIYLTIKQNEKWIDLKNEKTFAKLLFLKEKVILLTKDQDQEIYPSIGKLKRLFSLFKAAPKKTSSLQSSSSHLPKTIAVATAKSVEPKTDKTLPTSSTLSKESYARVAKTGCESLGEPSLNLRPKRSLSKKTKANYKPKVNSSEIPLATTLHPFIIKEPDFQDQLSPNDPKFEPKKDQLSYSEIIIKRLSTAKKTKRLSVAEIMGHLRWHGNVIKSINLKSYDKENFEKLAELIKSKYPEIEIEHELVPSQEVIKDYSPWE